MPTLFRFLVIFSIHTPQQQIHAPPFKPRALHLLPLSPHSQAGRVVRRRGRLRPRPQRRGRGRLAEDGRQPGLRRRLQHHDPRLPGKIGEKMKFHALLEYANNQQGDRWIVTKQKLLDGKGRGDSKRIFLLRMVGEITT